MIISQNHNKYGQPTQAKYRIVALGNLDQYQWSKFAPVLSLMEIRLLTILAVKHRRKLKIAI